MTTDPKPTKEILVRKDKAPGGTVRVYYEIDEQERRVGEPRIVFVDSETSEEAPTKPLSVDIEPLRKLQDLWLLEKPSPTHTQGKLAATRLEQDLASKRPINSEWAFYPKAWLTENNWKFYVDQIVENLEHWKRENGPHDLETAKTLKALKEEQKEIVAEQNRRIEQISSDALLKLTVKVEINKIVSLFTDFEQQGMVDKATVSNLTNHFTESAKKEPVPDHATPINWKERKYELVHFLRKIRGRDWLGARDTDLEQHFTLKGKPLKIQNYSIKATDNLKRIKEILKAHL